MHVGVIDSKFRNLRIGVQLTDDSGIRDPYNPVQSVFIDKWLGWFYLTLPNLTELNVTDLYFSFHTRGCVESGNYAGTARCCKAPISVVHIHTKLGPFQSLSIDKFPHNIAQNEKFIFKFI